MVAANFKTKIDSWQSLKEVDFPTRNEADRFYRDCFLRCFDVVFVDV